MKYLKLFDSTINEFETGQHNTRSYFESIGKLYQEIGSDDWNLYLNGDPLDTFGNITDFQIKNWEPFTDDEFKKIKKLLPSAIIPKWLYPKELNACRIDSDESTIIKIKDEWIFVSIESGTYKCDSIDGVIQLINEMVLFN